MECDRGSLCPGIFKRFQVCVFFYVWCVDCGMFKICIIYVVVIVKGFYCGCGCVVAICYMDGSLLTERCG